MARGSSKLVPWCRAFGRRCDKIRGLTLHSESRFGNHVQSTARDASTPPPAADEQVARCFSSSPGSSAGLFSEGGGWRRSGGIGIGSCGQFSTVADVTHAGSKSSDNDVSFGAPLLPDESLGEDKGFGFGASQFSAASNVKVENEGFFRADTSDAGSKSSSSSSSSAGGVSFGASSARRNESPASGRGPYCPASQFPEGPRPSLRNDRGFRARNNSAVANMLKLLEATSSKAAVEKVLEDHVSEFSAFDGWPWLPLLDALQRGPKPYLTLEVFNWKKDKLDGGEPREYAKMISTAGKLGGLEIATTLFKEMEEKGVKRTPITCNALMSAFSKNDQADDALAIFREMLDGENCKPTLVTFNTLISMYSKLRIPDMEKYFDMCVSSGFSPDRVTFNSMIWGYMRGREFQKMEEIYLRMKKSGCRSDPITFTALIIGYAKANEMGKMEGSFNHMQEEGFSISTVIAETLTEFYAVNKKFDKMERIMKIVSNTPGASCSSRIYGFAVQSYAESGRIHDMEATMDKMFTNKRLFTTPKTLEAVITAYANNSGFEALAMVLERIRSIGWVYQLSTYHTLLYEYGKGRELGRMEEVFKEMESAIGVDPTEETYRILADSYRSAGDEGGVKKIVDRMSAAGFKTKEVIDTKIDHVWTDEEIFNGRPR